MKFLYGICFYYGYFKTHNLINHATYYNALKLAYPEHEFQFICNVMMDETNEEKRERNLMRIRDVLEENGISDGILTHGFNCGGTLEGFFTTFQYMEKNNLFDTYVAYFEEDFYPVNADFLKASLEKLDSSVMYVGESVTGTIRSAESRGNAVKKASWKFDSEFECWTDGGYYFSNYERLKYVHNKIGQFHIGEKNTPYNHAIDGIDYGEVGFPTILHHNGFTFVPLLRKHYFVHLE